MLRYLCPPQKVPLSKFLMTSLRVICGLPPQLKILAKPMGWASRIGNVWIYSLMKNKLNGKADKWVKCHLKVVEEFTLKGCCVTSLEAVLKLLEGRVPPSRVSVPPLRFKRPPIESWALDNRKKNSHPGLKDPTNFLPKMVATCEEDLFCFWSSPGFGEKCLPFLAKNFFLFFVFIQFRRRKYIISTQLFVKLVKAAKASSHAKFYNLSTV